MKNITKAILISSVLTFASTGFVGNAYATYIVYGAGANLSCGSWLKGRKAEAGELSRQDMWAMAHWMKGFVSAAGYLGKDIKETDAGAMNAWADKYCAEKPLSYFADAVEELIDALSK
jgi:hypothetical protein